MKNYNEVFEKIEKIEEFSVALDVQRYENETATGTAAKRADINTKHRLQRLQAVKTLSPLALEFLAMRIDVEEFEKQIYAQDKIIRLCRFATGSRCHIATYSGNRVAGCGNGQTKRNNTLLMTVEFLRQHATDKTILSAATDGNITNALIRYGQPSSSAVTQAGSSLKALHAMRYIKQTGMLNKRPVYMINPSTIDELYKLFDGVKHI